MKLEIGKRYVLRNGAITRPLCAKAVRSWTEEGKVWKNGFSEYDVAKEYVEEKPKHVYSASNVNYTGGSFIFKASNSLFTTPLGTIDTPRHNLFVDGDVLIKGTLTVENNKQNGDGKMDMNSIKTTNLREARKIAQQERKTAEIEYAKKEFVRLFDLKEQYEREMTTTKDKLKEVDKQLKMFE